MTDQPHRRRRVEASGRENCAPGQVKRPRVPALRLWLSLAVCCAVGILAGSVAAGASGTSGDRDLASALAYVKARCPAVRTSNSEMWERGVRFNALYGACGSMHEEYVWFFDRGRFIGRDARKPSHEILGLWRDGRTLAFMYVLFRANRDAVCCATGGGAVVRFRLQAGRLVRVNALPPVQDWHGSVPIGR